MRLISPSPPHASQVPPWWLLGLALGLPLAAGGCGNHQSSAPESTPGTPAVTLSRSPADIDLSIDEFSATPSGPTTASSLSVHFVLANHGCDCTPYGSSDDGTLSYTPIQWDLYRDGVLVGSGSIFGLTGLDRVTRDVLLKDQPPGDRHYQLVVDPERHIPEHLDHEIQMLLTVPYGGSG